MVTGHGKLRSYLHKLGFIDKPQCLCEDGEEQTTHHLIVQCKKLSNQRNQMIKQIKNSGGTWPTPNEELVSNYLQMFVKFVKSTDFTDL